MINRQDRRDFLLETGVSPGEDDSYDKQKAKLIKQHGAWVDNTKIPFLQRLEILLKNARINEKPTGGPTPLEFTGQVASKLVPTPSEINPVNIVKSIPEVAKGIAQIVRHPIAAAKQLALDPPAPSTIAAMAVPGAALSAYRNTVPLAARTYLHHMAGIKTPFTQVTEKERQALAKMAQIKIDKLTERLQDFEKARAYALQEVNNIKLMNIKELENYAMDIGLIIPKSHPIYPIKTTNGLRDYIVAMYKRDRRSLFDTTKTPQKKATISGYHADPADRANVAADYEKITGEKLKGFEVNPVEYDPDVGDYLRYNTALGKTYIEPMIDKATGKVIPKRIQDTYKFYPDVYSYTKGHGLRALKDNLNTFIGGHIRNSANLRELILNYPTVLKAFIRDTFSIQSGEPFGILARKLAYRTNRPTTIIDIPLTKPGKMNAYDKAAILLGGTSLAKKER